MPLEDNELERLDQEESNQLYNWYGFPHGPNSFKGAIIAFLGLIAVIVGVAHLISVM